MSRLRLARWKHALREIGFIVVGVLIALTANAWWEGRQDRTREQTYLRQLLEDTRENERRFRVAFAEESARREAAVALMEALEAEGPIPPDSLRFWIMEQKALVPSEPRAVLGTFAAIQQTGDLNLLRDSRVRAAVVAYPDEIDADQAEYSRWMDRQAALMERIAVEAQRTKRLPRKRTSNFVISLFQELRDNPELRAVMEGVLLAYHNRLEYLSRMQEKTEHLRRVLEAEVAGTAT